MSSDQRGGDVTDTLEACPENESTASYSSNVPELSKGGNAGKSRGVPGEVTANRGRSRGIVPYPAPQSRRYRIRHEAGLRSGSCGHRAPRYRMHGGSVGETEPIRGSLVVCEPGSDGRGVVDTRAKRVGVARR